MRRQLLIRVIRALLLLEALSTALWIAGLFRGIAAREPATIALIVLRAGVATVQLVSFMLLLRESPAGRRVAAVSLLASAVLIVPEIGLRLVPTNSEPTFRWWFVAGYCGYAAAALGVLGGGRTSDRRRSSN
jgi:hypothetical protein